MSHYFILISILLPIVGAFLLSLFVYRSLNEKTETLFSFLISALSGLALLIAWFNGSNKMGFFDNRETYIWLPDFAIHFDLGLDGISTPFALIYCLIFPFFIALESSQGHKHRLNLAMLLLCQSLILGTILSLDLFFLFLFWSAVSLPVYFIMAFGQLKNDSAPGFRYIVFSWLSNAFLFLSFTIVYFLSTPYTFSLESLMGGLRVADSFYLFGVQVDLNFCAFLLFLFAFFLRCPNFLTAGWYVYLFSNTSYLVIGLLSAVLTPVSIYVFFKIGFLVFPVEIKEYSIYLFYLGIIGFVVGALSTLASVQVKKTVAYFFMSNVSLSIIGLTSLDSFGVSGGVFHLFSMAVIFSGVAMLLYVFLHKNQKNNVQALSQDSVQYVSNNNFVYFSLFILVFSLFFGPGTMSFVSFSQVVVGSYSLGIVYSVLLLVGVFLMSISGFMFFKLASESIYTQNAGSVGAFEKIVFIPLVTLCLLLGLYPRLLMEFIRPIALTVLSIVK